jgi:gluconolactonase
MALREWAARMAAVGVLWVAIVGGPARAEDPPVPPDAKLEKVFDGGRVLTEGVAVAPDGMVYFSDITFSHVSTDKKGAIEAGHIWRYDPKTGKTTIFRSPSGMSNVDVVDSR